MCSGSQQWRTTRHDSEEPQHHLTQLHSSQAPQPVSMICSAAWYYPLTHAASTNPDGCTSSLMSWIDIYITARWHIATGRYSHAVVAFVVAGSRRWRRAAMQTWTSVLDDALRASRQLRTCVWRLGGSTWYLFIFICTMTFFKRGNIWAPSGGFWHRRGMKGEDAEASERDPSTTVER